MRKAHWAGAQGRGVWALGLPLEEIHLRPRGPPATATLRPARFRLCKGGEEKVSPSAATHGRTEAQCHPGKGPGRHPMDGCTPGRHRTQPYSVVRRGVTRRPLCPSPA